MKQRKDSQAIAAWSPGARARLAGGRGLGSPVTGAWVGGTGISGTAALGISSSTLQRDFCMLPALVT